ncbi:hypothetical protein CC2G_009401 [Coprinopsis cinerea AmutBmut pab1-1]|nr:hypothetical protein CC2G_009401 [Coprinopsis cinerea AmutBmut pab1-1]
MAYLYLGELTHSVRAEERCTVNPRKVLQAFFIYSIPKTDIPLSLACFSAGVNPDHWKLSWHRVPFQYTEDQELSLYALLPLLTRVSASQ